MDEWTNERTNERTNECMNEEVFNGFLIIVYLRGKQVY